MHNQTMHVGTNQQSEAGKPLGTLHAVDQVGRTLCGAWITYEFRYPPFDPRRPDSCKVCAVRSY